VKSRRRFDYLSTTMLRAMAQALRKSPWDRLLRSFRYDIENELLERDLPAIAEESGGHPCVRIGGAQ